MDLNYLFYRQQVERSLADEALNEEVRRAHDGMARGYEAQIVRFTGSRHLFREPPLRAN